MRTHFEAECCRENMPRERLLEKGPQALSDYELLAILLRTGNQGENVLALSNRLLSEFGGLKGLFKVSTDQMLLTKGLGNAKVTTVAAAAELARRFLERSTKEQEEKTKIRNSADVYRYYFPRMSTLDREQICLLCLDNKNFIIRDETLYQGTINSSSIRVAEVFRTPILCGAARIILAHNHPSGDTRPSAADIVTTRTLIEAGRALDIPLMDHVIIGYSEYTSIMQFLD